MVTVKQFAAKHGLTVMRIRQFITEGRIRGARKLARDWMIPERAVIRPPANPRGRPKKAAGKVG